MAATEKRTEPMAVDIPAFAAAQLDLLTAELQSEMAETATAIGSHTPAALQRAGLALTNLVVDGRRTGMGGRTVLTLVRDGALSVAKNSEDGSELPEHGLRTGDIVLVAEQPGGSAKKREMRELEQRGSRGVITRVRRTGLDVGLDQGDSDSSREEAVDVLLAGRVWLVKLADDVTFRRMSAAMQTLQTMPSSEYTSLMRVLFGQASPSPAARENEEDAIRWIDGSLDASQRAAVRFALAAPEVALIHGPPGTGKTHALVELVLQLVGRGQRVLVCGPSNIAVDNLVERLGPHGVPMVRLGHPARLLPSVAGYALDVLTQTSEAGAIVRDVRADMDRQQDELRQLQKGQKLSAAARRAARRSVYGELRALRREYRDRERRCVHDLVAGSRVVLATLHGAGGSQLRVAAGDQASRNFDVVVIDEVGQALEAQCWVALLGARKVVCAGDHLQLPPTVKSRGSGGGGGKKKGGKGKGGSGKGEKGKSEKEDGKEAENEAHTTLSLEYTLFDRLLALHGDSIKRMLTTQYRMHERIMRFPSDTLYGGHLVAAEAVAGRLLRDLRYGDADDGCPVADTDDTREPLVFIDTQGGDFAEGDQTSEQTSRGKLTDSKHNTLEAALVRQHVRALVAAGVRPQDIAVVTPYSAQVALLAPLKTALAGLEVGTVDGFQGREKEAVVLSLVRSNLTADVGFLADRRRLNVAMTRPKRSLTVIGDSETWMAFLEEHADLRYPDSSEAAAEP
ncbi:DNA-binding protein smubp-2 [Grosmannia clavigera kw1407]|uniref:DNA helicase n=1 Tax=Grosmannia clavigera (strain kw1407 / UAMH 11150) TaxID=655863 RepID=F0XD91_GROCL|nr:DNA-binding protein smubp-2 [Grosmannia clavigera kw1407]EFX03686.1 DNA-binding protein smubp-2 [Grosmannia clavigera kw1407]